MNEDIADYVRSCHECARNKPKRHAPYGLLKALPIPDRPWDDVTMDFVVGLPESGGYNSVLVIVDRLTKMALYLPTTNTITAEGLAQLYVQHVFSKHGIPKTIVTDRGQPFAAALWREFSRILGIDTRYSTAYHPQTDGQTERVNQELESYLRFYISYMQDDWLDYLPLAEFARNNSVNSAIGMTPFYANYGFHPRFDPHVPDEVGTSPAGYERAADMVAVHQYCQEAIARAQERMAKYYDKKHIPPPAFKIGEKVLLKSKNITTFRPLPKLDARHYGPFTISGKISDWAYRLELPAKWKMHNVFHIDLLEPAPPTSKFANRHVPKSLKPDVAEVDYEVEAILEADWIKTGPRSKPRLQYLLKWKDYDTPTWEIYDGDLDLMAAEYYKANPNAAGSPTEPEEMKGITRGLKRAHRRV
jgi:hypothetical protein